MLPERIAEHESMSNFANDMVEGGILDRAKLEATVQMSSFVSAVTGSSVIVKFDESEEEHVLPYSCAPEQPDGWKKTMTADGQEMIDVLSTKRGLDHG